LTELVKVKLKPELHFFDHMLDQIARHGQNGLSKGDLEVDEHHTIEDTATLLREVLQSIGQ
jgi:imidazoleglycerol-phosphate dehydratase/histidinol-phosphatase